jgi:chromosome segregation protein
MFLAKAKFGQKTYSVIGQGMVEGFLNTSLGERKEFFDEATGVKQFQIKRDESLNKLKSSYENLSQAQMLLIEIEPRLKSLTRQVNKLQKRGELERELKNLQISYYGFLWKDINEKFGKYNNEFLELEKIKLDKDKKLEGLNRDLENLKIKSEEDNNFSELQSEISNFQIKKEDVNKKLARIGAQKEVELEAKGKFDLSFLMNKKEEIKTDLEKLKEEIKEEERVIEVEGAKDDGLLKEKQEQEMRIDSLRKVLLGLQNEAEKEDNIPANSRLKKILESLEEIIHEENISKIKDFLARARKEIKEIIAFSNDDQNKETKIKKDNWHKIQNEINELSSMRERTISAINEKEIQFSAKKERLKLLKEKSKALNLEQSGIEKKLEQSSEEFDFKKFEEEEKVLEEDLKKIQENIDLKKDNLNKLNLEEEKKRSKLFALQKDMQEMQMELNELNNNLQNIKINSTRYETKLEDLEVEIREELGSLKEVKEYKNEAEKFDLEERKARILNIKKNLEQIGGIDPQIEEEYNNTKERFDFLSGQVGDFMNTVDSLTKVIKELDLTIKARFDKEFKMIASKFEDYFKILFNGGKAKIIKVMDEEMGEEDKSKEKKEEEQKNSPDSLEGIKKIKFLQKHNATGLAGIEIQATPPGKKISSISMLSGGERALTAIALISAIISSNPSPFVVLDEVDAALDEANSERLAQILDDLSHKTQFIVITHNRASMRRASILYGVTMGDDGVSKLLSIKLEDAKSVDKQ